jgi:gluconate 5-dehydrogenase
MALSRAVIPGMKERRWGRVIHISSIMGLASHAGRSVYSATKAGLIGMAKAAALDVGPYGITVNCIAPGPFLTDLPRRVFTPEKIEAVSQRTALLRWGETSELMGPVLLLASDAGSFITGSVLVVDGGALARTM